MVWRVWIFVFTGFNFSCILQQLEEVRTVSHSFFYRLWKLWPSLHKLISRSLQKVFCLTLSSVKCTCTCMSTIPAPASCMIVQWRVWPHQQCYKLGSSLSSKYCSCIYSVWPEIRFAVSCDGYNKDKLCLFETYRCLSRKFKCLSRKFKCLSRNLKFWPRNQNASARTTTIHKLSTVCATHVYALHRRP